MKSKFILLLVFLFSFFLGVLIEHTRPAFYVNVLETIKKYSTDNVYKINVWCPIHHFMHEVLERIGFVNSSPVTYFIVKTLKKNILAKGWDDFRNWYIQMGDSDLY